jgi:hypothetical protein
MGYFERVHAETPTRFWSNNPTPAETRLAIEAGAIACTTNPTFAAKMIAVDPRATDAALDAALRAARDDRAAAEAWSRSVSDDPPGRRPPFSITHITGIFEEHLAAAARMLGGGARGLHHFTAMVGLAMDVTINWAGTADEPERLGARVEDRSGDREPRETVAKLRDLLPDFRRACDEDGLAPAEFADFGPVALFRGRFVDGWRKLQDAIRRRRDGEREVGR